MWKVKFIVGFISTFLFALNSHAGSVIGYYDFHSSPLKRKELFVKHQVESTFFEYYTDFSDQLSKGASDKIILAPSSFSLNHKDFVPIGQLGTKKSSFKYKLLSLKKALSDLPDSKLGIVQFSDHEKMKSVLEEIFAAKFKLVKSVTKIEDLLPLIIFKTVDFIAVPDYDFQYFTTRFNTKFSEIKDSSEVQSPEFFIAKSEDKAKYKEILEKISTIPGEELGFDGINIFK